MSGPDRVGMTWQPTWRRLIATTLVCFALVLALLTWRVQTGDDPALGNGGSTAQTAAAAATTGDTSTSSDTTTSLPSTGAS